MEDRETPWVQAALFCRRLVREDDGPFTIEAVYSRLVFRANDQGEVIPPNQFEPLTLYLRIMPGGRPVGEDIEVWRVAPSGRRSLNTRQTVTFEELRDHGWTLEVDVHPPYDEPGLNWYEVVIRGIVAMRAPLRVTYKPPPW